MGQYQQTPLVSLSQLGNPHDTKQWEKCPSLIPIKLELRWEWSKQTKNHIYKKKKKERKKEPQLQCAAHYNILFPVKRRGHHTLCRLICSPQRTYTPKRNTEKKRGKVIQTPVTKYIINSVGTLYGM